MSKRVSNRSAAFTLIELLMVIAIIIILVTVSQPLLSKLAQSNKRSQGVNLATTYISNARALAMQMRRPACVVFYEQSPSYSNPSNPNQTAVMIGIADPSVSPDTGTGNLVFMAIPARQPDYMPYGIRVAAIADINSGVQFTQMIRQGDNFGANAKTRAIVFDGNGQLLVRSGIAIKSTSGGVGSSTMLVGDWNFTSPGTAGTNFTSTPGILIYDYREFTDATKNFPNSTAGDSQRMNWLFGNSDVISINIYTGNVLR